MNKKQPIIIDKFLASALLKLLKHLGRLEWEAKHKRTCFGDKPLTNTEWESVFQYEKQFQELNFNLKFFHSLGWKGLFGKRPYLGTVLMKKLNILFVEAGMEVLTHNS